MHMDDKVHRYLYPIIPGTPNERKPILLRAFKRTIVFAVSTNKSATIVCSTKLSFRRAMADILPRKTMTDLLNGKSAEISDAEISDHVHMKLETPITIKRNRIADTILCLYAAEDMLEKIDSLENVTSIVVAPATKEAFVYWNNKWSPNTEE